jgi:hypothetical protein
VVAGWPAHFFVFLCNIYLAGGPPAWLFFFGGPSPAARADPYDPGFHGTMATAINAIPYICEAEPGLFHQPVFAPWRASSRVGLAR